MTDTNQLGIQMMNFDCTTYESAGYFPEIQITTKILFPTRNRISNIDAKELKAKILTAVFETVKLNENKEN